MNADGTNQRNLTNHLGEDMLPAWSPDGRRIAFTSDRDGNKEIYVMNADGTNQRNLTNYSAEDMLPAWSPVALPTLPAAPLFDFAISVTPSSRTAAQGGSVATTVRARRTGGPATSASFTIAGLPTGVTASPSSWSWSLGDQHRDVTFTVGANAPVGTHTITIQGEGVTRTATFTLTVTAGRQARGQKGQIAFMSTRDHNPEIYVMNVDGTNQRRLTNHTALDEHPAWSPDGTKIAFTSKRDGNDEIYVMNADGTNQRRLTNHRGRDWYPAWSPDGRQIAFVSGRDGNFPEIYVMNADGTGQRRLTNHRRVDWRLEHPAWSPDGTKIAFALSWFFNGSAEIYVMNADGTNVHNLTNHRAFDLHPVWSPVAP
jgi:Tol biopolymer transport system component